MIEFKEGDMFDVPADVRINTVNCVGVMGAGVALAFKNRHPDMFKDYSKACKAGDVKPGELNIWKTLWGEWIVNFPTKRHWREASRYEDIESGLIALHDFISDLGKVKVTLPALGCGHGGLDWNVVSTMIEKHLVDLDADIFVFSPESSRQAKKFEILSEEIRSSLHKEEILSLSPDFNNYPRRLKGKGAFELYVKGNRERLNWSSVSIVLSTKPQEKELNTAKKILNELLEEDIVPIFSYGAPERPLIKIALEKKANIILCLAEGILKFSVRKDLREVWDEDLVTIISASMPDEKWAPHRAYNMKKIEMMMSDATIITDPNPLWLSQMKTKETIENISSFFFIKYEVVNNQTSETIQDFKGIPIGQNPQTLRPNIEPIMNIVNREKTRKD